MSSSTNPQTTAGLPVYHAVSDIGRRRSHNEDAWGVFALGMVLARLSDEPKVWPEQGILLVVSDGMGGANAGEVASAYCVEHLPQELFARAGEADRKRALHDAFVTTHEGVMREARADPEKHGMGATLSVLWLLPDGQWFSGHVGDSRIYLRQDQKWRQVTEDQSVGAGMVRRGELSVEMLSRLRYRSMLEQVMGGEGAPLKPEIQSGQWAVGQDFLLCSDGLYGPLEYRIPALFDEALAIPSLGAAAQRLIDEANEVGGPDNITVVLARFMPNPGHVR